MEKTRYVFKEDATINIHTYIDEDGDTSVQSDLKGLNLDLIVMLLATIESIDISDDEDIFDTPLPMLIDAVRDEYASLHPEFNVTLEVTEGSTKAEATLTGNSMPIFIVLSSKLLDILHESGVPNGMFMFLPIDTIVDGVIHKSKSLKGVVPFDELLKSIEDVGVTE